MAHCYGPFELLCMVRIVGTMGMPIREETPWQTQDTLAWEHLGVPQEDLVEVAWESSVSLLIVFTFKYNKLL